MHQLAPTSCLLQEGLEARLKKQEAAAAQLVANIAGLQAVAKTAEVGAGKLGRCARASAASRHVAAKLGQQMDPIQHSAQRLRLGAA